MNRQRFHVVCVFTLFASGLTDIAAGGESAPKNIVYQGSLKQDGVPVTDVCDFTFSLYNGSTLLAQQFFNIDPEMPEPLPVVNGLFQASLNFGDVFAVSGALNEPMSIEIQVRCPAGAPEAMSTLTPRSVIEPAPVAYHALTVEKPDGHSLDASDGSPGNAVYVDEDGFVGMGTANPQSRLHLAQNAAQVGLSITAAGSWPAELRQTNGSLLSLINGGSERLSIDAGGDVGIGTTNPSARLDVESDTHPQVEIRTSDQLGNDAGMIIQGARNGTTTVDVGYVELRNFDSDEGANGTEFAMAKIGAGAQTTSGQTGWLRFMTNDGSGLAEKMRLTSNGRVGIGTGTPDSNLHLASIGPINLKLEADTDNLLETDNARILFSQDGGATASRVGYAASSNIFEITQEQNNAVQIGVDDRTVVSITSSAMSYRNSAKTNVVTSGRTGSDSGVVEVLGNNGKLNVLLSHADANRGLVQVYDENEAAQAGLYVNGSGQGVVFGDTKQFRVTNPADPTTDICYASLEGPEAAAYVRGTATLANGRATILLPEHFQSIASDVGMTVTVTPLSADSAGLAVTEKSTRRVVVRELNRGTGNYEFDYMITAVRKGHENFQVIQPTRRDRTAAGSATAARVMPKS